MLKRPSDKEFARQRTPSIAVAYSSKYGQSKEIADRIARTLCQWQCRADVFNIDAGQEMHWDRIDAIVVGGPVYATKFPKPLRAWLAKYRAHIEQMPSGFFSVSLSAVLPKEQSGKEVARITKNFCEAFAWQPDLIACFAGALRYTKYNWFKRRLMRSMVKQYSSDLDIRRDYFYTDWSAVDRYARQFAKLMQAQISQAA